MLILTPQISCKSQILTQHCSVCCEKPVCRPFGCFDLHVPTYCTAATINAWCEGWSEAKRKKKNILWFQLPECAYFFWFVSNEGRLRPQNYFVGFFLSFFLFFFFTSLTFVSEFRLFFWSKSGKVKEKNMGILILMSKFRGESKIQGRQKVGSLFFFYSGPNPLP